MSVRPVCKFVCSSHAKAQAADEGIELVTVVAKATLKSTAQLVHAEDIQVKDLTVQHVVKQQVEKVGIPETLKSNNNTVEIGTRVEKTLGSPLEAVNKLQKMMELLEFKPSPLVAELLETNTLLISLEFESEPKGKDAMFKKLENVSALFNQRANAFSKDELITKTAQVKSELECLRDNEFYFAMSNCKDSIAGRTYYHYSLIMNVKFHYYALTVKAGKEKFALIKDSKRKEELQAAHTNHRRALQRTLIELLLLAIENSIQNKQTDGMPELLQALDKIELFVFDRVEFGRGPPCVTDMLLQRFIVIHEKARVRDKTLIDPKDRIFTEDFGMPAFLSEAKGIKPEHKLVAIKEVREDLKEAWEIKVFKRS